MWSWFLGKLLLLLRRNVIAFIQILVPTIVLPLLELFDLHPHFRKVFLSNFKETNVVLCTVNLIDNCITTFVFELDSDVFKLISESFEGRFLFKVQQVLEHVDLSLLILERLLCYEARTFCSWKENALNQRNLCLLCGFRHEECECVTEEFIRDNF